MTGSLVSQYMILRGSVHVAGRSGWGRRNALGTSAVVSSALLLAAVVAAGAWWQLVANHRHRPSDMDRSVSQRAYRRLLCRDNGVFSCLSVRRRLHNPQFSALFSVFKGIFVVSAKKNDRYRSPRRRYIQKYMIVPGLTDIAKVLAIYRNETGDVDEY